MMGSWHSINEAPPSATVTDEASIFWKDHLWIQSIVFLAISLVTGCIYHFIAFAFTRLISETTKDHGKATREKFSKTVTTVNSACQTNHPDDSYDKNRHDGEQFNNPTHDGILFYDIPVTDDEQFYDLPYHGIPFYDNPMVDERTRRTRMPSTVTQSSLKFNVNKHWSTSSPPPPIVTPVFPKLEPEDLQDDELSGELFSRFHSSTSRTDQKSELKGKLATIPEQSFENFENSSKFKNKMMEKRTLNRAAKANQKLSKNNVTSTPATFTMPGMDQGDYDHQPNFIFHQLSRKFSKSNIYAAATELESYIEHLNINYTKLFDCVPPNEPWIERASLGGGSIKGIYKCLQYLRETFQKPDEISYNQLLTDTENSASQDFADSITLEDMHLQNLVSINPYNNITVLHKDDDETLLIEDGKSTTFDGLTEDVYIDDQYEDMEDISGVSD